MMNNNIKLTFEEFGGEEFLKISHSEDLRPFFMSVVSDSDHWMFISSNGGLTAGRKNADNALFPYATDDKVTESFDITGSKSIFHLTWDSKSFVWEPFSNRNNLSLSFHRNVYKNVYGNIIVFEEILDDVGLIFRYSWSTSEKYGFVRRSELFNNSSMDIEILCLDGIQNLLPYGVNNEVQRASSNLVDAYKRSELVKNVGLGIYALSAIIVDKAEPSEALKANLVWSLGLDNPKYLLSSLQLDAFRRNKYIKEEVDVKGEKGAYFALTSFVLSSGLSKSWTIVADVDRNHSQCFELIEALKDGRLGISDLMADIDLGTKKIKNLVGSADGHQFTNDAFQDSRHYANVLFNIMRGGIFDNGYVIEIHDFKSYLKSANREVYSSNKNFLSSLQPKETYRDLIGKVIISGEADLIRLTIEYLPLKFSRRHGDPSRPWNKFSINLKDPVTNQKILDYEGNWRDIFQNWEALAYAYPEYIDGMIFKFLNSSTFEGYNPYRITKSGFDWETIEADDPWSYIGYWGDHQIIYLQKFLEIIWKFKPQIISNYLDKTWFVYAAVPYIIKPYEAIILNPKDTIIFDHEWDSKIRKSRDENGADGALLRDANNRIYHVNLVEKLLAMILSKLSNFIPEGGIWLNTQRPEWNDANNALVGNGVSMVTLYYIRRFMVFFQELLLSSNVEKVEISTELIDFYNTVFETLDKNITLLDGTISDFDRKTILDSLGRAASDYRKQIYNVGFSGVKRSISINGLKGFIALSLQHIDHSIEHNQRKDKLYHAYNLMTYKQDGIHLSNLDMMLEGQVGVLSSGKLSSIDTVDVLDAMKKSALYRQDQNSYILYPNKQLLGFLEKNLIPEEDALASKLIQKLVTENDKTIVEKDVLGQYHFNGNFKNEKDLRKAISDIQVPERDIIMNDEEDKLLAIFEKVFNHKAFTGRSGTFYGYEGLGSIYWHMVSKLLLSVQECCIKAIKNQEEQSVIEKLLNHYYEIKDGIGIHKSPTQYGAFPTDPYSHTPMHRGAQQPGMTGQVKEDILCRWGELGIEIEHGIISFNPFILRSSEFLDKPKIACVQLLSNKMVQFDLVKGQLLFTYCQVPIIYEKADTKNICITYEDNSSIIYDGSTLTAKDSKIISDRSGKIRIVKVTIDQKALK